MEIRGEFQRTNLLSIHCALANKHITLKMVATFSPHRDTGGTLHLHSPTGMHHVDAGSAIRQLRRSLSRSPSKNSDFRLMPSRNHSPSSKNAPFVSSPLSPSARRSSGNLFLVPPSQNQSPLAIPFPPSAKINRPGLRRTGTLQSARSRANPTSPAKRVLSDSRDNGNSTPAQAGGSPSWEEPPMKKDSNSQSHHSGLESTSPTSPTADPADNLLAPKPAHPRIEKRRSGNFGPFSSTSSPLKRSDGIMNLDQASLGSPSAKRRSLHGASYGPDFNIFDHECGAQSPAESSELNTGQFEQRQPPQLQPSDPTPGPPQHYFSTIPKRSSSLRKSTLQQRQSGSFFSRAKGYSDASTDPSTPNPMAPKTRQRMSLDGHLFSPNTRDPPFSPQNLFSNTPTSTTPPTPAAPQNPPSQFHHPAHPLSRTITQSSSSSSIADDSPTHEPLRRSERPRPLLNFSKSLPAGSARPGFGQPAREESNETTDSFATPNNYKLVKPLPAAFMSTGLISKKNRNADDPSLGNSKNMPDTPCKRQSNIIPGVARDFPEKSMEKSKQSRHPFAPPSTPAPSNSNAGPAPRGTGIFGASLNRPSISRRGSFVSIDGDDRSQPQSPAQHSSQSTIDSDLPPTPTKQSSVSHGSQLFSRSRMNQADRTQQLSGHKGSSCKLSSIEPFPHGEDGDSDSVMEDSPSAYLGHKSSDTTIPFPSSIPRSRPMRNLNSPTPIPNNSFVSSSPSHINHVANTKLDRPYAASPLFNKFEQATPHTPQEHILPPDPSGLSISVHSDQRLSQREQDSSALPATPTAPREYFAPVGKQSTLSLSGYHVANVDTSLTSRFEKVELVGTGEFSQVYRVTEAQKSSSFQSIFSLPSNGSNGSPNSNPERVCAVKKSKHPYVGVKDRQRRIQEVDVLKSLKDSDHIISFMDSWEDKNHLYIQTEFCEEGSLDMFLAQVGLKARLDDFRIWKILLELSLVSSWTTAKLA